MPATGVVDRPTVRDTAGAELDRPARLRHDGAAAPSGAGHPLLRPARWILRQPIRWATLLVLVVAVARSGINTQVDAMFLQVARSLPRPIPDYRGVILLSPVIARILGLTTFREWAALHVVTEEVLVVLTAVLVARRFERRDQRLFCAVAIAGSGLAVVSLNELGWYDVWVFMGAVLLIFGERWGTAAVGGALFGCTNVEQACLALAALALCAIALRRNVASRVLVAGATALAMRLAIQAWYALYGVHPVSRAQLLGPAALDSLHAFARSWPIQVYGWYSASWVLVAALIWFAGARRGALLVVALVLVPAAGSILTLDGTRVFVGIALPAFLLLVRDAADRGWLGPRRLEALTAMTLTAMLCTPGLMTWFGGSVVVPWSRFV